MPTTFQAYVLGLAFMLGVGSCLWSQGRMSFYAAVCGAVAWPLSLPGSALFVLYVMYARRGVAENPPVECTSTSGCGWRGRMTETHVDLEGLMLCPRSRCHGEVIYS